jgi:hypothetical protein
MVVVVDPCVSHPPWNQKVAGGIYTKPTQPAHPEPTIAGGIYTKPTTPPTLEPNLAGGFALNPPPTLEPKVAGGFTGMFSLCVLTVAPPIIYIYIYIYFIYSLYIIIVFKRLGL